MYEDVYGGANNTVLYGTYDGGVYGVIAEVEYKVFKNLCVS